MKSRISCVGPVLVVLLFAAEGALAQTPTLSLEAVSVNGIALAPSNSVTVKPGDSITAEIFASDWSPDGERLRGYQADITGTAFNSGTAGVVTPVGWDRPTPIGDDIVCGPTEPPCPAEFPVCKPIFREIGICVGLNHDPAQGVFIDQNRADWVFFDPSNGMPLPNISAVDFAGPPLRYGAGLFFSADAQTYTFPPKYCGTLKLEVSNDASGTFAFEINLGLGSVLLDPDIRPIEPLAVIGLTIDIDPCGNGMIDAGEACDDGLSNSDTLPDTCRNDCTLPTCGDNVKDSTETCDGADLGDCSGSCADDCTCRPVVIPTVSAWGFAALTLSLLVAGRVYFGRRYSRRPVP